MDGPGTRTIDEPTDLPAHSWWSTLTRTVHEARDDHLTDWAAALTYYGMLALFPALIVLVALLGVFGSYPRTTNALLDIVRDVGPASAVDTFQRPIDQVVRNKGGAGALLGLGLVAALWSGSGYIGAFIRANNVIYETHETRRYWMLRPLQIGVTIIMVFTTALVGLSIVVTGPLAHSIGDVLGIGSTAVTIWGYAKWPILLLVVMTMIAFLYWVAPSVEQPAFRWITPGGVLAVLLWLVVSMGFGVYVRYFGSYDRTYGALAGVIVFLVWLWLTNLAILFGAEFNSELERGRELAEGLPAQEELQLEPRGASHPH